MGFLGWAYPEDVDGKRGGKANPEEEEGPQAVLLFLGLLTFPNSSWPCLCIPYGSLWGNHLKSLKFN